MKGILTIAIGERYCRMAQGLIRSLRLFNQEIPVVVVTENAAFFSAEEKVLCISPIKNSRSGVWQKVHLDEYSPFESTLFIDADCLVFGSLDQVWADCEGHHFGIYGKDDCDPREWWYFQNAPEEILSGWGRITKFNSGICFFRRGGVSKRIFSTAREFDAKYAEIGLGGFRGDVSDEPLFSIAMAKEGIFALGEAEGRFALPTEFGFQTGFGDVYKGVFGYIKDGRRCTAPVAHFFGEWATCYFYRRELFRLLLNPKWDRLGLTSAAIKAVGDFCYLSFLWLRAMVLRILRPNGSRLAPGLVLIPATSFFTRKN